MLCNICNIIIMNTHHPESRVLGHLLPSPPVDAHLSVDTLLEEFPAAMFVFLLIMCMFHMNFEVGPVEVNNDVPAAVQLAIPLTLCNTNLNIETLSNRVLILFSNLDPV